MTEINKYMARRATELLEGVTEGPWKTYCEDAGCPGIEAENFSVVVFGDFDENDNEGVQGKTREEALANARFIAASRELVPALVAENMALLEALESIRVSPPGHAAIIARETLAALTPPSPHGGDDD